VITRDEDLVFDWKGFEPLQECNGLSLVAVTSEVTSVDDDVDSVKETWVDVTVFVMGV
jgi:hypothetical protein